jgi:hypothetical protein
MTITEKLGKLTASEVAAEIAAKEAAHREEMTALRAVQRVLMAREKKVAKKPATESPADDNADD